MKLELPYEYRDCGITFSFKDCLPQPRRFVQYTRNGKRLWRDYKRDVKTGITMFEYMKHKQIEAIAQMTASLSVNVYSPN